MAKLLNSGIKTRTSLNAKCWRDTRSWKMKRRSKIRQCAFAMTCACFYLQLVLSRRAEGFGAGVLRWVCEAAKVGTIEQVCMCCQLSEISVSGLTFKLRLG